MRRVKRLIRTRHVWHRMTAVLICMVMVLGMVFQTTAYSADTVSMAEKAAIEAAVTRAADKSTINDWKKYFTNETDTSNAGRIWTDKTVADGDITVDETGASVKKNGTDSFLVGLSAMGATQSVRALGEKPVDVMLVLDISSSMVGPKIKSLIEATNLLMQSILDLNPQNRIGCVLFSGGFGDIIPSTPDTAACVLPMDYYTTKQNFLNRIDVDGLDAVEVDSAVQNSSGTFMNPDGTFFLVEGDTYIQNGLLLGYEQFDKAMKVSDVDNRVPILTLITDGAPTSASTQYTKRGTATINLGSNVDIKTSFPTQLTASWVKKKIAAMYQMTPRMYTMGITANLGPNTAKNIRAVLDPRNNTFEDLDAWWNQFFNAQVGENKKYSADKNAIYLTKVDEIIETFDDRYYTDQYFEASTEAEIESRINEIMLQILNETAGLPIEQGTAETLVFEDSIGEYMNVTHMNGVMCDGVLNSGSSFARNVMNSSILSETVIALQEQLNITDVQANQLLDDAKRLNQISYESDEKFSNYVTWYADAGGTYIGSYNESTPVPIGAQFINRSYFYYGNPDGLAGELLKLGISIEENLTTHEQKVKFSIPPTLLPLVRYESSIPADNVEGSRTVKTDAVPMHLFYEINLREGISKYNLNDVSSSYPHLEITETSKRGQFYTNRWTSQEAISEAESFNRCVVSNQNKYYYYTEDTPIYTQTAVGQYELYIGETQPKEQDGTNYFYLTSVCNLAGGGQNFYLPIDPALLKQTAKMDSGWVIPEGTFRTETMQEEQKTANKTETSSYTRKPSFQSNTGIVTLLGNNGTCMITQGKLEISKNVWEGEFTENDNENTDFQFEIGLMTTENETIPNSVSGEKNNKPVVCSVENGIIKFELKMNESIEFWLPIGSSVSVEEVQDRYLTSIIVIQNGVINEPVDTKKINVDVGVGQNKVKVVNRVLTGPYSVYKVNQKGKFVGGAEFKLYRLKCKDPQNHKEGDHNQIIQGTDSEGCWELIGEATSDKNSGALNFKKNGKPVIYKKGLYRFVEVKAPDGYVRPVGQWNVYLKPYENTYMEIEEVLGPNGEKPPALLRGEYALFFVNYKAIDPPITGGGGTWLYSLFGSLGVLGGIGMVIYQIRRKKYGNS